MGQCILTGIRRWLVQIPLVAWLGLGTQPYYWALGDLQVIPSPGVLYSKPLGGSKVDSAFHPSEVDKMRTRNFWELNGKK